MGLRKKFALAAGAFVFAVLLTLVAAYQYTLAPVTRAKDAPRVPFTVTHGATFARVAATLETLGLVRDERALRWYARVRGRDDKLRAGEYELSPRMSAHEILTALTVGRVRTHSVVLPEGLRIEQIAERLARAGLVSRDAFVAVARDPAFARARGIEAATLEGYLFPETYQLARGLAPRQVADALLAQFFRVWAELEAPARARGLSRHEVVTLASIIEKETARGEERPLIAAVFHNRLARGMRLETDPTVIYGIANFNGNLQRRHLEDESNPYNTYRIPALPPGPIASPGAAALRATIAPADTKYLFFVARGDGSHQFSETYEEHAAAVRHYQLRRRK